MPDNVQWCSVDKYSAGQVLLFNVESIGYAYRTPSKVGTVAEILSEWGETWIWDYIEGGIGNLYWLNAALLAGTAILVSDGSYNRQWSSSLASAGWKMPCTARGRSVSGSFTFRGKSSNAYRAEVLGLYALHAFLLAVCTIYELTEPIATICCDNE